MLAKYTYRHCPLCSYTLDCPCNGFILLLAYVQLHKCAHVSSIAACCLVMSWLIDEKGNKPRRARFRSFNFNHSQLVGYCFRVHIPLPCLLLVSSNLFTVWTALHHLWCSSMMPSHLSCGSAIALRVLLLRCAFVVVGRQQWVATLATWHG